MNMQENFIYCVRNIFSHNRPARFISRGAALFVVAALVSGCGMSISRIGTTQVAGVIPHAALNIRHGSGFYVNGQGDLITNRHVAESCQRIYVDTGYGVKPATYVAHSNDADVALLHTERTPDGHALLADANALTEMETIFAGSYPNGRKRGQIYMSRGYHRDKTPNLTVRIANRGSLFEMVTSRPIRKGASGSPVLNRRGAVVGMVAAHLRVWMNAGYAVRIEDIRDFLEATSTPYSGDRGGDRWLTRPSLAYEATRYTYPVFCHY